MIKKIRIATRGSKLALWQAEYIAKCLKTRYPGLKVELIKIKTTGDKILDVPLAQVGGKGLFVKEIEEALLDGRADIAVHSMKDVPTELPEGLKIGIIPRREINTDILLSQKYPDLMSLPKGARVGTSSLRRQAQLLYLRPDLKVVSLRGNLDTRVKKLTEGEFDAIVVAGAGLKRLGLKAKYEFGLVPPEFFPAVAQGALGIEYLEEREDLDSFLGFLDDFYTRYEVLAERAFLIRLEGGCQVPIGAFSIWEDKRLVLRGLIAELDGSVIIKDEVEGKYQQAEILGKTLAEKVLAKGGQEILDKIYQNTE